MSLFSAVASWLHPAPPDQRLAAALARVDELVSPLIRAAGPAERELAGALEYALGYSHGLVDALPGPVDLGRQSFARDPLVHAIFASAEDIGLMLGRSQAVRDYLADPACLASPHFYALFAARRQQKKQLGIVSRGEVIQRDVPQTVVYFSDHTLVEAACTLEHTALRLREMAFDSLLKTFHDHIEALKGQREGLRADLSVARAHLTVLRGKTPGPEFAVLSRHQEELAQRLAEAAESLMPAQLAAALTQFLRAPQSSLNLTPVSLRLDRLGVVIEEEMDAGEIPPLNFVEVNGRDRRHYLGMLARIDREEARAAVEAVSDQQRRFLLI